MVPGLALAAHLALAAYAEDPEAEMDALGGVLLRVIDGERWDTRVLVGSAAGRGFLAFRGTILSEGTVSGRRRIVTANAAVDGDIRRTASPWFPGLVHTGFLDAYAELREALFFSRAHWPHGKILIAGHSLGGALATMAAWDLDRLTAPGASLRTFGSPRVGNHAFAAAMDAEVTDHVRVRHEDDIIPTVPIFGYRHCGRLLRLTSLGHRIGPVRGWLRRIALCGAQAVADACGSAERDHHMAGYVAAVEYFSTQG